MKLTKKDIGRFISAASSYRGALFFGPDEGQAGLYKKQTLHALSGGKSDALVVTSLTVDKIASDPSLLYEALASSSLLGDACLVAIEQASDKIASILKEALATETSRNFLLVCAGDLSARSSLRALFEKEKNLVSMGCYRDEGADLSRFIEQYLKEKNIRADRDCLVFLTSQLGNDRAVTTQELEKISLFLNGETSLSLADARLLVGGNDNSSVDELCQALGDGQAATVFSLAEKLLSEGESGVALLRIAARYFDRLVALRSLMQDGLSADMAIERLKPPVFFKQKPALRRQVLSLSPSVLTRIHATLLDAEIAIKHGKDQHLTCLHHLSLICRLAKSKAAA